MNTLRELLLIDAVLLLVSAVFWAQMGSLMPIIIGLVVVSALNFIGLIVSSPNVTILFRRWLYRDKDKRGKADD